MQIFSPLALFLRAELVGRRFNGNVLSPAPEPPPDAAAKRLRRYVPQAAAPRVPRRDGGLPQKGGDGANDHTQRERAGEHHAPC